jgi:hypothetical protein
VDVRSPAFAAIAGVLGLILLVFGLVLADENGPARMVWLVCLAYGVALFVAAVFIAAGRNPLRR